MFEDVSDDAFLAAFESCTLPRATWTHEAHVRMAWIYLRRESLQTVIPKVRQGIQRLNASYGNHTGYHDTVTVAFLRLVDHRLGARQSIESFSAFRDSNRDLFDREDPILAKYYGREALESDEARSRFVEPDLLALPGENHDVT